MGKTMSLLEVIQDIKESEEIGEEDFHFMYINGLKLKSPKAIYSEIYKEFVGYRKNAKDSCRVIGNLYYLTTEDFFFKFGKFPKGTKSRKGKKYTERKRKIKVIAIDELDYLYTQDQNILYNIFDWPHFEKVSHPPKSIPSPSCVLSALLTPSIYLISSLPGFPVVLVPKEWCSSLTIPSKSKRLSSRG